MLETLETLHAMRIMAELRCDRQLVEQLRRDIALMNALTHQIKSVLVP
jgi:hypothetical protein